MDPVPWAYAHVIAFIAYLRSAPKEEKGFMQRVVSTFTAERAMQGSDLIPTKSLPKFQALIYSKEGAYIGMCCRIEGAILTAAHVLERLEESFEIRTDLGTVTVNSEAINYVNCLDLAFVKLDEKQFSVLGLTKGNLANIAVLEGDSFYAMITGFGLYSMGTVTFNNSFGMVTYTGSTAGGFSGAPYVSNKTIYGIHTGAGAINLGISAAYIRMLLSEQLEDTAEWLENEFANQKKRGQKIDFRTSPGDPDMVEFRVGREYHMVDAEIFFRAYNPQSYVQDVREHLGVPPAVYPSYRDSDASPKNLNAAPAVSVGASGKISDQTDAAHNQKQCQPTQIPTIQESTQVYRMDTQIPMRAQLNEVLPTISKTTSYQPEARKNRPSKKQRQQLKKLVISSQPIEHGLEMLK